MLWWNSMYVFASITHHSHHKSAICYLRKVASGVVVTKLKWWKRLRLNNGSKWIERLSDNIVALSTVYHSSFTAPNWYLSSQQFVATVDHKTRPPTYWLTTSRFFLLVIYCCKPKTQSVGQKSFDWHFGQGPSVGNIWLME